VETKEVSKRKTQEKKLRRKIQESVRHCAAADKEENRELFLSGVARRTLPYHSSARGKSWNPSARSQKRTKRPSAGK
jgi:hypothetical protein